MMIQARRVQESAGRGSTRRRGRERFRLAVDRYAGAQHHDHSADDVHRGRVRRGRLGVRLGADSVLTLFLALFSALVLEPVVALVQRELKLGRGPAAPIVVFGVVAFALVVGSS